MREADKEVGSWLIPILPVDSERKDILLVICLCKLNRAGSLEVLYCCILSSWSCTHSSEMMIAIVNFRTLITSELHTLS
jgi:hypothetical protein